MTRDAEVRRETWAKAIAALRAYQERVAPDSSRVIVALGILALRDAAKAIDKVTIED